MIEQHSSFFPRPPNEIELCPALLNMLKRLFALCLSPVAILQCLVQMYRPFQGPIRLVTIMSSQVSVSSTEVNTLKFAYQFQEKHFCAINVIVSKPGPRTLKHNTSIHFRNLTAEPLNHITSVPPASSVSQDSKEAFESKMRSASWEEAGPF